MRFGRVLYVDFASRRLIGEQALFDGLLELKDKISDIIEKSSYSTIGGPHEATGAIGEGGARTPRQQRVQEGDAQS